MMRAADTGSFSARLAGQTANAPRPKSRIVASALICAALTACGQRGPLYYPHLPPEPGSAPATSPAVGNAAPVVPIPMNLPTPQTRLLDGTPTTIIAAPDVSMPEAGTSTMPFPTQPSPANTPSAGGTITATPPAATTTSAPGTTPGALTPPPQSTSAQ